MQAIKITWDDISRNVCRLSRLRELTFPGMYAGYQEYVRWNFQECMQAMKITRVKISRNVCRLSRLREMNFQECMQAIKITMFWNINSSWRKRNVMIKLEDDIIRKGRNLTPVTTASDEGVLCWVTNASVVSSSLDCRHPNGLFHK
jgi:hypothetical protein